MSSSKAKTDADFGLDIGEDALSFPAHSEPTDDSPTIISKTHPLVEAKPSGNGKITDLNGKPAFGEGMVNGLRGRRLAHYELIEPIGVGGMAAVLRAHDTQLDRQVALKILPPEMAADPENVQRFHQEAKAAARLDHENIARVFFCGEDQGLNFIAFEFVEGDNLRTLLERRRRLPVPEAVRYVLQIATGLEHASSRGVVHRDVKPSNIIVSPNGRAKLVDMGLARNMERREQDLTHSGVTLGTFDYLSPEQAMEPRDADARSDIYSLGCTFYHMLTGQPPVPEGTAAKKLHHHQHIDPVDPRQLNRDIPDEIALILGRMMDKDPRRRYQRPLQLVQHLMQVARKVGAADDLPEGALFLDTPLPTGPRSRPVLIVSVVALALAAMVGLVAIGPGEYLPVVGQGSDPTGAVIKEKIPIKDDVPPKGVAAALAGPSVVVTTAAGLLEQAKSPTLAVRTSLKLKSSTIHLKEIDEPVTFSGGRDLVIEPASANRVTVEFEPDDKKPTTGIVLAGGRYTFRNLKFQVNGPGDSDKVIAGVVVRNGTHVTFEKCSFEQKGMPLFDPKVPGVASVRVEADVTGDAPRVDFSECFFHGSRPPDSETRDSPGQVAVAVDGAADIHATDCAFKPHGAFFNVLGHSELGKTKISLKYCSGFVFSGPVFRFKDGAAAKLKAQHCLFSRYKNTIVNESEPDFIRQLDAKPIGFQGEGNYYHNLNALWSRGDSVKNRMEEFTDALKALSPTEDYDKDSIARTLAEDESPWNAVSPEPLYQQFPEDAFQVKPEYYQVYGVRKCSWGKMVPAATPGLKLANGVKLLDPDFKGKQENVFDTLEKALVYLEPGDTLLIKPGKAGMPIEIPPTTLKLPLNLTIKAYERTTPVLKLGKPLEKKDYAFFRALDGKLCFEGLHFLLEARTEGVNQSIVQLGDSAYCSFDRCVVTMKAKNQFGTSVVAFVDPKDWMRTEPRPTSTEVKITNSFIRGEGDLVKMTSCRPFKLGADDSVVAVSGSMVDLQAVSGDDVEHGPTIVLNRVSALTRDAVFSLRTFKNGKGLAKMTIDARSCLFAPIGDRPLVFLMAPEVGGEDLVAKYVDWKPDRLNRFGKFDKFLELERPNDNGPVMMLDADRFMRMFGANKNSSDIPTMPPLADLILWQVFPADLRPTDTGEQFFGFGATVDQLEPLIKALK